MTQMASILTILRIQVVWCNQMTWCNLVPIFRSIWVNVPIKEGRHGSRQSNAFPTLHPTNWNLLYHMIRSHLRRCLSGSLCCTRLGPSPLPLPRLSIVRREQSVRSGGEHEFECPVLACTTLYSIHSMDWLTVKMYTNSCDVCSKIVGSNLVSLFLRYLLLLPWARPENKMYHTDKMDLVFKV